ncbi:hypothetical protein [Halorientalis sp. IM1011]|uniref:hypothetical protein n=1 Tax=Halorientalis sp. IM1011 TaxID=1932360 RepID=UPI00352ABD19
MSEDWDSLLLLDACRYDLFADRHSLPGNLSSRMSRGSNTREFLLGNFHGKTFHDTVYVTASPMLSRNSEVVNVEFHAELNVWLDDGWDDNRRTVLPETTADQAREAAAKYPEKRLLVHFIQPHYPFIGSDEQPFTDELGFENPDDTNCWRQVMTGDLQTTAAEVWSAYEANLDRVLPVVAELLDTLDGKTVVTSDHGNMIGERARPVPITEWGHPYGIYTPELVTVPWLEVESSSRREIVPEPPVESTTTADDDVVKQRLRYLGYTDP